MHPLLSIAVTLCGLLLIMCLSAWATSRGKVSGEVARKSVHVGMGVMCMTFPWLFSSVLAVQVLAAMAVFSLLIIRLSKLKNSLGSALFTVQRLSIGELLFPVAVAWIFTLGWDQPVFYVVALLLLTLADTASALAGSRFGKKVYQTAAATKSLEGSLAFFLTAFVCTALPLYYCTDMEPVKVVILALTISIFTTALEGASGHGLDNLLVPLGTFLLLDYYAGLDDMDLIIRSLALILLLLLLVVTRRLHGFNGGAILASVLFGFAAFTLGGLPCLVAALIVFMRHLIAQIKVNNQKGAMQSIDTIIAIGVPSLVWVTLGRGGLIGYEEGQLGFICTMALVIAMLHSGTSRYMGRDKPPIISAITLGGVALLPSAMIGVDMIFLVVAFVLSGVCACGYFYWRKEQVLSDEVMTVHSIKLAAIASVCSPLLMLTVLL